MAISNTQIQESSIVEGQRHFISHTESLGVVKIQLWLRCKLIQVESKPNTIKLD